ncbi:Protein TRM32 [Cardamine amara subsp. amara]|uniref:Protein TRM32 n=1 Tax=Cardamine amara subsp. amara TaxID=228776 RepID=A0ABD1BEN0_CARAN
MSIENHVDSKTRERDQLGWISGFLRRKKRSSPQEVKNEENTSEDSRLMRRNKGKNLHLNLSEIMRKLKHAIRKEDKRLLEKKNSFQEILSTKDHFFLERMTSISPKRSLKEHSDDEKHLSEMLNIEDFDLNLAKSKQVQRYQRRIASLSFPFSSPERIGDPNSTVLSRSASESETIADDSITIKEIDDEISKVEVYDAENDGQILKETPSLLYVASPSHHISKTEEYDDESVLEPLFIEYEITPARGEPKIQLKEQNHPMDDQDAVFKYVKAVVDAIESNWEELYLKTEFSDQLLNPALISNIPFYPNELCVEHELLFDCINEVVFEFCRFPPWVSSRSQVLSFSGESIINEVQEKVYCHLLSSRKGESSDQIVREDMAKPRSWLDVRCELECIGFETSELILKELLEELMF